MTVRVRAGPRAVGMTADYGAERVRQVARAGGRARRGVSQRWRGLRARVKRYNGARGTGVENGAPSLRDVGDIRCQSLVKACPAHRITGAITVDVRHRDGDAHRNSRPGDTERLVSIGSSQCRSASCVLTECHASAHPEWLSAS